MCFPENGVVPTVGLQILSQEKTIYQLINYINIRLVRSPGDPIPPLNKTNKKHDPTHCSQMPRQDLLKRENVVWAKPLTQVGAKAREPLLGAVVRIGGSPSTTNTWRLAGLFMSVVCGNMRNHPPRIHATRNT